MMIERLRPQFVDSIPEHLDDGVIYISVRYRTATHLCACGCGSRIVTPIKPARWKFTYDGESISLWPSVGNWQKECKSHYVIRENEVQWRDEWSDADILLGRTQDQVDLRDYYSLKNRHVGDSSSPTSKSGGAGEGKLKKLFRCLKFWS